MTTNSTNSYDAFTYGAYPDAAQNAATDYVDPTKYDAIVSRFTDITADITFPGKSLRGVGGTLQAISKYNDKLYATEFAYAGVQPSRKAYNSIPLITMQMGRHGFTVTAIEALNPLRITTNTPHGIYSSQRFQFSNVASDLTPFVTGLNNQNFYVKKIDNNTVELYWDKSLTSALDASTWADNAPSTVTYTSSTTAFQVSSLAALQRDGTYLPAFSIVTLAPHNLINGQHVRFTGFTYYTFLNNIDLYVKVDPTYPSSLYVYTNQECTSPLDVTSYDPSYNLGTIAGNASFTVSIAVADIAESATFITASNSRQIRVTTDVAHNLIGGVHDAVPAMPVVFSNSNYINFGSTTYYVKIIDNFTLDLYLDAALTVPALTSSITFNKSGTAISADTLSIVWNGLVASSPLKLQASTAVAPLTGRKIRFAANDLGLVTTTDYYIKAISTYMAEVYLDAAFTTPYTIADISADTYGVTSFASTSSNTAEFTQIAVATTDTYNGYPYSWDTLYSITASKSHRYEYYFAPAGTGAAYMSASPIAKWATGQRVLVTDSNSGAQVACYAKPEFLAERWPMKFSYGNIWTEDTTGYKMMIWIVRFYSDRACTVPLIVYSASGNTTDQCTVESWSKFYITSYYSVSGVKFLAIGKSATAQAGPFTGSTDTGAAKLIDEPTGSTPETRFIFSSTTFTGLNYSNTTNPSPYYAKYTFVSETHNDTTSSNSYNVELFSDSARTIPVILNPITKNIAAVAGTLSTTISNASHRTLRYVPIADAGSAIQNGQSYTFSGAYKSVINGTRYVKVIRRVAYTGQDSVTLCELYYDSALTSLVDTTVVESAVDTNTFYYPMDIRPYSNLYMPKVSDNADFPWRSGMALVITASHIPYLNGNSYFCKEYLEAAWQDDPDVGRHRLDFYTDADMTARVNLQSLAQAGTIPKLDSVATSLCEAVQKVLNFTSGSPAVATTNSQFKYADATAVIVGGSGAKNFSGVTLYTKYQSSDTTGSYYAMYTNIGLTTPAVYTSGPGAIVISATTLPSANEPYPYKGISVNPLLRGGRSYGRYNSALNSGAGGTEFSVWADAFTARSGITNAYGDRASFTFTPVSTTDWRIGTITLDPTDPGKFAAYGEVAIKFAPLDDFGAPAGSVVDIENGLFNTHDAWTTAGSADEKVWPTNIRPNTAMVRTEQPTRVTTSQNQQRYTRTSGNIRYAIELTYPPMTKEDFAPFRAAIEAMQGQWNTCNLPLSIVLTDDNQVNGLCNLYNSVTPGAHSSVLPAGSTVLSIEGLTANSDRAIISGQFISISSTDGFPNGGLAVALHDSPSNSWGESKVRISHPSRKDIAAYADANLSPETVVVSLNTDTTEYSINTAGYYSLKVSFIASNWA